MIEWWDVGKAYLGDFSRQHCIAFACNQKSRRKKLERNLSDSLQRLNTLSAAYIERDKEAIREIEGEMCQLDNSVVVGARVRCHVS
jgi:hypothetical protein